MEAWRRRYERLSCSPCSTPAASPATAGRWIPPRCCYPSCSCTPTSGSKGHHHRNTNSTERRHPRRTPRGRSRRRAWPTGRRCPAPMTWKRVKGHASSLSIRNASSRGSSIKRGRARRVNPPCGAGGRRSSPSRATRFHARLRIANTNRDRGSIWIRVRTIQIRARLPITRCAGSINATQHRPADGGRSGPYDAGDDYCPAPPDSSTTATSARATPTRWRVVRRSCSTKRASTSVVAGASETSVAMRLSGARCTASR
ncbi:MAG: hypothetical protein RL721_1587 [Candidatus Eisenbacteria bacterium]